ncbi:MAG: DUF72 domain-containing protein [Gaiellales bacterium]
MSPRGRILIGCSGWNYAHWREPVYHRRPASQWLQAYAGMFDTVEVNATFYRLPTESAVRGWTEQTPDGFVIAVKASRYLTHIHRLANIEEGVRRFFERIAPLANADRMGPVLWQLPETFHRDDDRLATALELLPPGRHAFEFRHPSWFCRPVEELLRRHACALVIAHHPQRPFQTSRRTADWMFVRLHYGQRGRGGNYSRAELVEWAGRIRRWAAHGDVYAYLNNDWLGTSRGEPFAVVNARLLQRLCGAR